MIAFATLFLGLVFGTRPVEVGVGAGVRSVDVYLDGCPVAALTAPPWKAPLDFGSSSVRGSRTPRPPPDSGRPRATTPRVVLLILGGSEDASDLRPEEVRRYLRSMNVPLLVWASDGQSATRASAWGDVEIVRDAPSFLSASDRLLSTVSFQRIVWLEGAHLPQSVSLSPKASSVSIAR